MNSLFSNGTDICQLNIYIAMQLLLQQETWFYSKYNLKYKICCSLFGTIRAKIMRQLVYRLTCIIIIALPSPVYPCQHCLTKIVPSDANHERTQDQYEQQTVHNSYQDDVFPRANKKKSFFFCFLLFMYINGSSPASLY